MPRYTYQSLTRGEEFIFDHGISEPAMTRHPETGERIERIITGAPAVHMKGLAKHVRVNYRSPAATACGCASNHALAEQVFSHSRTTPKFGSQESRRTITGGVVRKSTGCGHSHGHAGKACNHTPKG